MTMSMSCRRPNLLVRCDGSNGTASLCTVNTKTRCGSTKRRSYIDSMATKISPAGGDGAKLVCKTLVFLSFRIIYNPVLSAASPNDLPAAM